MSSQQHPGTTPPPQTMGRAPRNGMGTAALVLGIIGVVFAVIIPTVSIILGALALVFGVVGSSRARSGGATNGAMALTGAGLGALAIVGSIVVAAIDVGDGGSEGVDTERGLAGVVALTSIR